MKRVIGTALKLALVFGVVSGNLVLQGQQRVDPVRGENPVDVLTMPRPIEMHDSVWIGELTTLEVRDLIKAGKTTALILGGGMEDAEFVPVHGRGFSIDGWKLDGRFAYSAAAAMFSNLAR